MTFTYFISIHPLDGKTVWLKAKIFNGICTHNLFLQYFVCFPMYRHRIWCMLYVRWVSLCQNQSYLLLWGRSTLMVTTNLLSTVSYYNYLLRVAFQENSHLVQNAKLILTKLEYFRGIFHRKYCPAPYRLSFVSAISIGKWNEYYLFHFILCIPIPI